MGQTPTRTDRPPPAAMSIDVEDWFHVENLRPSDLTRELGACGNFASSATWIGCSSCWTGTTRSATLLRPRLGGGAMTRSRPAHRGRRPRDRVARPRPRARWLAHPCGVPGRRRALEGAPRGSGSGPRCAAIAPPSFSITEWAIPELREAGFRYDSSVFATVAHDRYGSLPGARPDEPSSSLPRASTRSPSRASRLPRAGSPGVGGGYFRLMPYRSSAAGSPAYSARDVPTSSISIPGRSTPTSRV